MPHIDELLGVSTVAAAAMFVAIALQPALPVASQLAVPAPAEVTPRPTVDASKPGT